MNTVFSHPSLPILIIFNKFFTGNEHCSKSVLCRDCSSSKRRRHNYDSRDSNPKIQLPPNPRKAKTVVLSIAGDPTYSNIGYVDDSTAIKIEFRELTLDPVSQKLGMAARVKCSISFISLTICIYLEISAGCLNFWIKPVTTFSKCKHMYAEIKQMNPEALRIHFVRLFEIV